MIYFDNNATTPLLPEVRAAMLPYLDEEFGNPNSVHQVGNQARVAVEKARNRIAAALEVMSSEIMFTGCGSESNNHALIGTLLTRRQPGKNLVISSVEHPSVATAAAWAAETFGFELRTAPIRFTAAGIDARPFIEAIDDNTVLVSVMMANNETGCILPVAEIFAAARANGAVCHVDAIQGLGKIAVKPKSLGADLLSFTAHKYHGPKGAGGLFIRRGLKLESLIHGGPQENTRRAGTENVANIVGLGVATEKAIENKAGLAHVRDYFEDRVKSIWGDRVVFNFADLARTPNTSSAQFIKQDGNVLLIKLDRRGICVSTGAACSSGTLGASKGLLAMGLTENEASATLRFSFSTRNTSAEVDQTIAALREIVKPPRQ